MRLLFTKMAERCLQEIESFALEHPPQREVSDFIDGLVIRNYDAILEGPELYRYNETLLNFGLKIRERLDSAYRCLYEVHNDEIHILLFLHSKQDLVSSLYRHQITRTN